MTLALSRPAAQRRLEQRLVDATVEDGNAHLHALADHLLPLHVKFLGKLGRGEVIGHGGPPRSLKSGRQIFTPGGGRVKQRAVPGRSAAMASRDNDHMAAVTENRKTEPVAVPIP